MADPKKDVNIQDVINDLKDLMGYLDEEINKYDDAKKRVKGKNNVSTNRTKMINASNEIANQIERIDEIIMDNPEIRKFIGSLEGGEVEKLNSTISSVLEKVEKIKSLGIKDLKTTDGKDVSLDTKTGKVVTEVEKLKGLDPYLTSVDYDSLTIADLETKISELEDKVSGEEEVKKYDATKKEIADGKTPPIDPKYVDFSSEYGAFITEFEKKLEEYEKQKKAEEFSTKQLKQLKHVKSVKLMESNGKVVKTLIDLQKSINGEKVLTSTGEKISELEYENLKKKGDADIEKIFEELTTLTMGTKTAEKAKDLSELLENSPVMKVFEEDKAKMEGFLATSPLNATELRKMITELGNINGKNYVAITRFENFDPQENVAIRKEIDRLTTLRDKMKLLEETKGKTFEVKDITKIEIDKVEVKLRKPKELVERVVDLKKDSSEMKRVVNQTYNSLSRNDKDTLTELRNEVIRDSKEKDGIKLPRDFGIFSKIAAWIRGDKETKREKAITNLVKNKIKTQIEVEQSGAIGDARGQKREAIENAETERIDAFALDKTTREQVNKNAYEAARVAIINKGKKAEDAYKEAGREAER